MVGTNPAISQLSMANYPRVVERLKRVEKRPKGRVVFVNPRRTESSAHVGCHMPIRPGSDVFFFLAFAHVLLSEFPPSRELQSLVSGLDALRNVVAPFPPERVEALTSIPAADLRQLVRDYCTAESSVMYAGTGVNQGPEGTLAVWLLNAIQILSGHFDRKGTMLMTRQQQRTARLVFPTGDKILRKRSRFGDHPSVIDSLPAGILADEILTPGEGQLRAMFVTAGNPLLSCPNSARLGEALQSLELLVCIDLFRNETGNLAHYILPATSFLERSDVPMGISGYQPIPYAQFVDPVVQPRGESKDEWWIFAHLNRVCGVPFNGSALIQWWLNLSLREKGSFLPRLLRFAPTLLFMGLLLLEKLTLGKVRRNPHGILLEPHEHTSFLKKGILNEEKRVRLAPKAFLARAAELEAIFDAQLRAKDQLLLITKRERRSHNSWMHNAPSLAGDARRGENLLTLHPSDAAERGITEGEECELQNGERTLRVKVTLSDEMMPKSVALPHGWGHQNADGLKVAQKFPGVNANLLAPDGAASLEPLSGMSHLTAIGVEVRKLKPTT